jgi:DNA-directed RNA polymerase specialized sigma24 family protein
VSGAKAWAALLTSLDDDPASAARAYEALRAKLVALFSWKGCSDAPALADQVFDRVARKLDAGERIEADNPARYVVGVARRVYLETVKAEVRQRRALDRAAAAGRPDPDEARNTEARLRMLEACLQTLSDDQRTVVLRYHEGSGHARIERRRQLAEELGVPINALRIRLHRLRGQLETCVRDKLAASPGENR